MAHLIDTSKGFAGIAYIGETPWHGLGQRMEKGASLDKWRIAAGLDFEAVMVDEQYEYNGKIIASGDKINIRSDNGKKLGNVTDRYQIVQPSQVVEFFRDLCSDYKFEMETMGTLDEGRKVWALAKTGNNFSIKGQDRVESYLLLGTSFDGKMATQAMFTNVRVVCNNTITLAYQQGSSNMVKIPHKTVFNHEEVKIDLGIYGEQQKVFEQHAQKLATIPVNRQKAMKFILEILTGKEFENEAEAIENLSTQALNKAALIYNLFDGKGKGAEFKSSRGTAWGVVNAITEYYDWHQGRTENNRFKNAQFGKSAELKAQAFATAEKMAA